MSSLKQTPIKYSEYVEWFEKLEEIRKVWYAYFLDLASKTKQYEETWDSLSPPPTPNAIPTNSTSLFALAEVLKTSLTADSVFGTDYKENKVKKINDNKGIIIVRNNVDDETYYAGIANNITLSTSEKNYKVLIQNQGCDCMGFGINTDDTFSLDDVWPSDSHSLTKCASKNTLSGYKWYKAKPLNTEHSALFGHSIIDLLQTIKNPQTVSAMAEANDKIEYDLEVKQLEVDYDINADIDLGTDPDLGTDVNLTTVLGRPIKYNIQAVFGLNVNYDLLKDKEISVDCSCNNSCVEDPIILLNKEKTAIIRQGLKVKGPYLITITPKLKHWEWASNLCFYLAAHVLPIRLNSVIPSCSGCTKSVEQCDQSYLADCCCSDEYINASPIPGPNGTTFYTVRVRTQRDTDCNLVSSYIDTVFPSGNMPTTENYWCSGDCSGVVNTLESGGVDPIKLRHCPRTIRKGGNIQEPTCTIIQSSVTPVTHTSLSCVLQDGDRTKGCGPGEPLRQNLCEENYEMPLITVPSDHFIGYSAVAHLLSGITFLQRICIVDALAIIRSIVEILYDKNSKTPHPAPEKMFLEDEEPAPSSMTTCLTIDEGGVEEGADGHCAYGMSLFWRNQDFAFNVCCTPKQGEDYRNLIDQGEPCSRYNTLHLNDEINIRFKRV